MGTINLRDIYPNFYSRPTLPTILAYGTAAGRRSLVVPNTALVVGTTDLTIPTTTIDLDTIGNWDSAYSTYATAANRAGKDFTSMPPPVG